MLRKRSIQGKLRLLAQPEFFVFQPGMLAKDQREENAFGDDGVAPEEVRSGWSPSAMMRWASGVLATRACGDDVRFSLSRERVSPPAMTGGQVVYRRPDLYVF